MNNTIIPTHDITGNIGSCTTSVTSIITQQNLFTNELTYIATNSCDGSQIFQETWGINYLFFFAAAFVFAIICWSIGCLKN